MKLRNCNFKTWIKNHDNEHKDISYRALYPYNIFEQVLFDNHLINQVQTVSYSQTDFEVTIKKIELQENGKFRTTFDLKTWHKNHNTQWKKRSWNEKFQIVYTQDYNFITVFTKNEDSSKTYIKKFYKGSFEKISNNKSIPISDLLFKSLVTKLAESIFDEGEFGKMYLKETPGIRILKIPKSFSKGALKVPISFPLFSIDRKVWLFYAFDEETAHRIAYFNCRQCEELYVIYCNPVYTKHFRCTHKNVHVLSLYELIYLKTETINSEYIEQVRFLQNHLKIPENVNKELYKKMIWEDESKEYRIETNQIIEALAITKIKPTSKSDLRIYLASANLINAWLARQRLKDKKTKLFKNMYFFKTYVARAIASMIDKNDFLGCRIYIDKGLVMFEIDEYQYSFHSIPKIGSMRKYERSDANVEIIWKEKRLQPISSIIYELEKST